MGAGFFTLYLRHHSNYEPQVDKLLTDSTEVEGINLITTYENQENPLTFEMIEMLVKYYLL